MKRFTLLAVFSIAALAASHSETSTYVDGTVKGVSPNTGGTLVLSDDKVMEFRTGLANVQVPYEGISKVELGAVKETSHDVPLYKVWALHKRFTGGNKSETQLMIVNYKNEDGEEQSMTLELAEPAVKGVLSTLANRTGKSWGEDSKPQASAKHSPAKPSSKESQAKSGDSKNADGWWGDDYWKTTRNADKWNKSSANNNNNN